MEAHNNWITNNEMHDSENVKFFSEVLHNLFKISPNHNPEVIDDLLRGSFMVFEDPVCYQRYAESLILESTFDDSVVCMNIRYPPFDATSVLSESEISSDLILPLSSEED